VNRKERRRQGKKVRGIGRAQGGANRPSSTSGGVSRFLLGNAGVASTPSPRTAPGDPASLLLEGERRHRGGDLEGAQRIYDEVLAGNPKDASALALSGLVAHQRGNFEHARHLLETAISVNPGNALAHNALGNTLRRLGQPDRAIGHFKQAIEIDPTFAAALSNAGLTYRQLGELETATEWFRKALKIAPHMAETWSGLARSGRITFSDEEASSAERILSSPALSRSDKRHIGYALGKHYDETGDFEKAMAHFHAANGLREVPAEPSGAIEHLRRFRNVVPDEMVATAPDRPAPIFIFGMPRSGTTLVEQILASHGLVHGGGELNVIEREVDRLRPAADTPKAGNSTPVANFGPSDLGEIRQAFFDHFGDLPPGVAAVTDKSPFNFEYLGIIARAFPDARLVHCKRDPLDTCLSIYFTDFDKGAAFTTDLDSIGRYYRAYQDAMEHWHRVCPLPLFEIVYEALLDDQVDVTRALIEFCGLEWDESCLRFFENKRLVSTPSDWQVRQPLYEHSRGRAARYADRLEPLLKALNSDG